MLSLLACPLLLALLTVAVPAIPGGGQRQSDSRPTLGSSIPTNSSNISPIGFENVQCSLSTALHASSETCVPVLYSILNSPGAFAPKTWRPGNAESWDTGTGCSISATAGDSSTDTLSPSSMVGPVIWAVSRCFKGEGTEANGVAMMKAGARGGIQLKIVLGPASGNTTTSAESAENHNFIRGLE